MPEGVPRSEAKQALLEKCLLGEITLITRTARKQAREVKLQEATPANREGAGWPTDKIEPGLPVSSQDQTGSERRGDLEEQSRTATLPRRVANRILHLLSRFAPGGYTLRPFLHRLRGVRIGKHVWIGDEVYLDDEFPRCIEIQDGAKIQLRATVLAHTHGAGRVIIGKNAFVGVGAVIVAAAKQTLVIGEGSAIIASSMVNRSVPPHTLYGSDCSKPIAQTTKPFSRTSSYEELIAALRPLH